METKITKLTICGIKNISQPIFFYFSNKTFDNNTDFSKFNIKGIYGENGSGKTACMYAVRILKNIVQNRNYLKDESTQKALYELVNKTTKQGFFEVEYYCSFGKMQAITSLTLEFKINNKGRFEIVRELLKCKKSANSRNKYINIYETHNGQLKYFYNKNARSYIDGISKNILLEQSMCSIMLDHYLQNNNMSNIINEYILSFLFSVLNTKVFIDKLDNFKDMFNYADLEKIYDATTDTGRTMLSSTLNIMHYSQNESLYVIDKKFYEKFENYVGRLCKFVQLFKVDLKNIIIDSRDNGDFYICSLVLEYGQYNIDLKFESSGIKKLFRVFQYLEDCNNGQVVFIDELDTGINSIYLNKLLDYFSRYGDGQLCFTAHNLATMSILKHKKKSIDFLSNINTVHTWSREGNLDPESVYRKGFIKDSPFNIEPENFIGIFGG